MSRSSAVNEYSENDYVPNAYFQGRHAERSVEHCTGNSCDNLVAMDSTPVVVRPQPVAPEIHRPLVPIAVIKPSRSDLNEEEFDKAGKVGPMKNHAITEPGTRVSSSGKGAEAFQQSDYYAELRRRSLEGRAPVSFGPGGVFTNPLEESLASDEFDAALY